MVEIYTRVINSDVSINFVESVPRISEHGNFYDLGGGGEIMIVNFNKQLKFRNFNFSQKSK